MSHTGMVQPSGPSSQRRTRSGLVWHSQTSSRGASNVRVATASSSFAAAISSRCAIVLSLGFALGRSFKERTSQMIADTGSILFPFALRRAGARLQFLQQRIEALEVRRPHFAVALDPIDGLVQPVRLKAPRAPLRFLCG